MSELKHLYPILPWHLKLLSYLNIIQLNYELCDMRKSFLWLFNSDFLVHCFELVIDFLYLAY